VGSGELLVLTTVIPQQGMANLIVATVTPSTLSCLLPALISLGKAESGWSQDGEGEEGRWD
jgi:hypothetical protein